VRSHGAGIVVREACVAEIKPMPKAQIRRLMRGPTAEPSAHRDNRMRGRLVGLRVVIEAGRAMPRLEDLPAEMQVF